MTLNYSILFTIELLHEYFLNRRSRDLEIVPTRDCAEICGKMNIQLRNNDNQFIAFIRENDAHEPFINTAHDKFFRRYYDKTVFRFYLKLNDPAFLNYTNIEHPSNEKIKLYFSNLAKNQENGIRYLTLPVKEFAPGATYIPGELVKDPATGNVFESIKKNVSSVKKKSQLSDASLWAPKGMLHLSKPLHDHIAGKNYTNSDLVLKPGTENVYEAIKRHSSVSSADLDDASMWVSRGQGQLQYPTGNDFVKYCGSNYIFKLAAPVATADIAVFGFNYNIVKPGFTEEAIKHEKINFARPVTEVKINLSALAPGRYAIKVNKETRVLYYDPMLNAGNILGIVEIFNHLPGNDDYALLNNDEKINNTRYHVQFPNRRVLWKYVRKDGKADRITDTGKTKYEFDLNGENFISRIPIPLSESSLKTLKLEFNTKDFALQPLPNPRVQHLGMFNRDEHNYFCSEVYLNY